MDCLPDLLAGVAYSWTPGLRAGTKQYDRKGRADPRFMVSVSWKKQMKIHSRKKCKINYGDYGITL